MLQFLQVGPSFSRRGSCRPPGYAHAMLLGLEVATARSVGALSRLAGRGGGTTLPGNLLLRVDAGAIDRLAAQLERGSVVVSATNGKTSTTAMVAEILGGRLAYNHSG